MAEIGADHLAGRDARQRECQVARAAADIDGDRFGPGQRVAQRFGRGPAPIEVAPEGQKVVEKIVARRHRRKHLTDRASRRGNVFRRSQGASHKSSDE